MKNLIHWAIDSSFHSPRVSYDTQKPVWAITDPNGDSFAAISIRFPNEAGIFSKEAFGIFIHLLSQKLL
jgi:hypothetical protein